MYRCELCNRVSRPGERASKVVTERRPTEYPSRGKAQRKSVGRRSKMQDDPGGAGYQIAKEVVACPTCAEEARVKQAAAEAASVGVDKWSKTKNSNNKRVATSGDGYDPLALLKEQLSQQDIKLEQMSAALRKLADKQAALEDTQDKKLDKIMPPIPSMGLPEAMRPNW